MSAQGFPLEPLESAKQAGLPAFRFSYAAEVFDRESQGITVKTKHVCMYSTLYYSADGAVGSDALCAGDGSPETTAASG
jgi:hypothetical protein